MPDLATIVAKGHASIAATQTRVRAALAWNAILDKPTPAEFITPLGQTLPEQTVRLEFANRATEQTSTAGLGPVIDLIIFGVKGHPTVPDTDMGEGYVFVHAGDEYTCVDVIATIGEIQGIWRASG